MTREAQQVYSELVQFGKPRGPDLPLCRRLSPLALRCTNLQLLLQCGLCPLLATSRIPGHVASTSALPPAADIRAPKSAFALISSAVPPGADSQDGGAVGPEVTLCCHRGPDAIVTGNQWRRWW